jgi:TctA family transporter
MLLATVGQDVFGMGARFTLGVGELDRESSLFLIPAMIGLFGLSEVLRSVRKRESMQAASAPRDRSWGFVAALRTTLRNWWIVVQSSVLGTVIGALPGAGADIAAWAAYGTAQRISRKPEQFGAGCEEGVVAPTAANNAAVAGAWIPALVFGVPGDAVTAIVLGVFVVYKIQPGPEIFESGGPVYTIFAIAAITQLLLIPAGWIGIQGFGLILRLPRSIVLTAVVLFSAVGAYAINSSLADVGIMIAFGALGFYLESQRVPLAPLILGMILGGDMMERYLRSVLTVSGGDWTALFTRPISIVLVLLLLAAMCGPLFVKLLRRARSRPLT